MKWQIDNKQREIFQNCKHGEYLKCSNNFILSLNRNKNINWSLLCFPNGHDLKYKNYITFQLFTKQCDLMSFSTNPLVIELAIIFEQISFKQSFTLQFHPKQLYQYITTKIPFTESNKFSELTFHWNIQSINESKEPEQKETKQKQKTLRLNISPYAPHSNTINTKTVWQIEPSFIPLLINNIGYTLWSDIFSTDKGIKFQLQIKNSLTNNKYPQSMSVYLHLLQLPQNIKIITCNASIFCIECNTKNYGVFDMSAYDLNECKTKTINLLRPYSLEIYELKNIKTLSVICEIEILKMISFATDIKQPIYLKEIKNYNNDNQCVNNYEWKINENQLLKFKNARNGKVFCGPKYDIWYLKCSPNGYLIENKGCVQLDVCNLYMPSECYKIISYITLRCRELNISFNDTIEFTLWNRFYSWPVDILKTNQIQALSQITFEFDMKIIKVVKKNMEYNNNNNCSKYNKNNYDEIRNLKKSICELKDTIGQLQKQMHTLLTINPLHKPCDISEWLTSINLKQYIGIFMQHGYDDFLSIGELTDEQLFEMGIQKKGHRIKLLKYIQRYIKQNKLNIN